jgi:hypothetical protein
VSRYAETTRQPTPSGLFAHLAAPWKQEFTSRGFQRGCPVMATAAEVVSGDSTLNEPLRAALGRWEDAVADELARVGVPARRCRRLAILMLSTLEGAIMLARVHGDVRPLTTVVADLAPVLDAAVRP